MTRITFILALLAALILACTSDDADTTPSDTRSSVADDTRDDTLTPTNDLMDDLVGAQDTSEDGTQMPDFGCPATFPPAEVRYESRFQEVLGASMHYYEAGPADGPVILLLHGLPVSAYFWRNVMPYLEDSARVIALDHIGFGRSARPEGLNFGLEDQVRYLDAFIRALDLNNIVVVGQDLGSWVGMTWASRNPDMVRAIALVEGIIPPLLPASTATTDPNLLGIWQAARDPEQAQRMFVDDHFFLPMVLPGFTACGISPEAMAAYAAPWEDPASRHILYATPAEIPIDGVPTDHVASIDAYIEWIESTTIPKLFVHATPGALMSESVIEEAKRRIPNVTTANIGGGIHFLAESKPDDVGEALATWFENLP